MSEGKCHDCGAEEGQMHELGCDMERCPFCGGQLITCDCVYEILGIDCSEGTDVYKNGLNKQQEIQWEQRLFIKGRVPYMRYPNICGRCGELWPALFTVSNEEWEKYIPIAERQLIICKACFVEIKCLIEAALAKAQSSTSVEQETRCAKSDKMSKM